MCQVEEDDINLEMKPGKLEEVPEVGRVCIRCGSSAVIHLRDEDFKCEKCFVSFVHHKFRVVLTKQQISRSREKFIVGVSGGPSSCALMALLQEATVAQFSKLFLVPVMIYIDEMSFNTTEEQRLSKLISVMDLCHRIAPGRTCFYTSLEMVFAPHSVPLVKECDQQNPQAVYSRKECSDQLQLLMKSLKTLTAKEEMLKLLRVTLLRHIGRQLGITNAFVGDTVDRLAVQLITNTALGKGKHLPMELGYLDTRDPNFTVVRPLKEISMKEISAFNRFCNISSVPVEKPLITPDLKAAGSSIYQYTEKFIFDLQQGFPQTLTTLCKTGDKLCSSTVLKNHPDDGMFCLFCAGPMDSSEQGSCTAENSIALSLRLSHKEMPVDLEEALVKKCGGDSACGTEEKGCGDGAESCCSSKTKSSQERLCYSCSWLLGELADRKLLPARLATDTPKRVARQKLRESIKEFLLDDTEG